GIVMLAAEVGAAPAVAASGAAPTVAPPAPSSPRVHHAPVANAKEGERLELRVTVEHPELLRYVGAIYQPAKGELRAVPFLRGEGGSYVAVIPGEDVIAPGLGYTIEIEQSDGRRVAVFASRSELQPVAVAEDRADARERALLSRLEGRRSLAQVSGEF